MREEKQLLLDDIKERVDQSPALVIARYAKLSAGQANELRKSIIQTGGDFEVVRKRVFLKAAAEAGVEIDPASLQGHIGLFTTGEDPVVTTKAIYAFAEDNKDTLEVLAGQFDGQVCTAADVEVLSKLPGKDAMRAQFLSVLVAPMANTLSVTQALLTSVVYALDNKVKKEAPTTG